ncbi:hypothetical protein Hanom_Chr03g00271051 [Helianthus anomalus]
MEMVDTYVKKYLIPIIYFSIHNLHGYVKKPFFIFIFYICLCHISQVDHWSYQFFLCSSILIASPPNEKAVLVAVYKENPSKRRLTTRNSDNIKHHHHHHHHHLHIHQSKDNKGNRRAELLSYSQRLRESSKVKASTPPHHAKPLVASTSNDQETDVTQVIRVSVSQICF